MRKSRVRVTPKIDARSWSRREVLARGAGVASILALPGLWRPKAWGAQAAPFDYFISTTGNDTNPGTLAAPWALTSFNVSHANNAKMAGKRIGIIAGNYSITTSAFSTANANEYNLLSIPAGTAANPTYVASCDTSGNYSARAATLTWQGGATNNGIIGCAPVEGGQDGSLSSYITIDGLRISGNGSLAPNGVGGGHLVMFNNTLASRSSSLEANIRGIIVQNCELYNINPQGSNGYLGGNYGLVFFVGTIGAVCQNNLIHDVLYSGTDANAADHQAGCVEIGAQNTQYLYNTFYNCHGIAIYVKEGSTGSVAAYNYFYACSTTAADRGGTGAVFSGWDGGAGDPNPGPTPLTQLIHHNVIEGCGPVHMPTYGSPVLTFIALNAYNNTVYDTNTSAVQGWLQSASGCTNEYYNNIYMTTSGSSGQGGGLQSGKINVTPALFASTDYNCYFDAAGSYTVFWGLGSGITYSGTSGFTSWKGAVQASVPGSEAHSLLSNPTFALSGGYRAGGGANQFQLASGSPCLGTGRGGANMGAWDGTTTQIGCSFAAGSAGSANPVPVAPTLTVS